ncbi:MAG: phenylalanine--tRNA ligase subunit alpha [Nitrospinae bacterium]|nr:phenylalanine--tRNA ligase subunit alpha [Nitrospinota bacterium]
MEKLLSLKGEVASVPSPADEKELESVRIKYLGKKGVLSILSQEMRSVPADQKPEAGKLLQEIRSTLEGLVGSAEIEIKRNKVRREIEGEFFDTTLPSIQPEFGSAHPISAVMDEITDIFSGMGFQVEEGPETESDLYNFEKLNFPPEHPARDMQDTFHLLDVEKILRTHTSPVQVRAMEKYGPPLAVIAPGKVYRCDADVTHSPMFHQIEGFVIDKNITMGDLKGTLKAFATRLYGADVKVRLRPSFFPFVEPGAEMDVSCVICGGAGCRVCKQSGWLEILGAGMIHPNVLKASGIDPDQWGGFAFGLGIERIAMLKYGVDDIRLFFENDMRFLRQFKGGV